MSTFPSMPLAGKNAVAGALNGLVIADFGRVLAGPYATMLLADLGAEVVKVERPQGGDDTRAWGPPWSDGQATYFQAVNRNKQSLSLDLNTAEGVAAARELARRADVVVENFRPGVMARLGLDYDTLHVQNARLVYCSISGFGSGPGAAMPGYDLLVQAMGGLMSMTGDPDGEPSKVGVAVVDVITGMHAAIGILAAVRHAERTGHGQRVEVNLLSSLLSAMVNQSQAFVGAGVVPRRMGNQHPSIAPYETFQTADQPMVLAVGNNRQFITLCEELGLERTAEDPRFSSNAQRVAHRDALRGLLTERLRDHTAHHWSTLLMARGVPCGPINSVGQGFALAGELGLDPIVETPFPPPPGCSGAKGGVHFVPTVANPIRLSLTPATYRSAPPHLSRSSVPAIHVDTQDVLWSAPLTVPGAPA